MPNVANRFVPRSRPTIRREPQNCLQLYQLSLIIGDWPMYLLMLNHLEYVGTELAWTMVAHFLAFIFGVKDASKCVNVCAYIIHRHVHIYTYCNYIHISISIYTHVRVHVLYIHPIYIHYHILKSLDCLPLFWLKLAEYTRCFLSCDIMWLQEVQILLDQTSTEAFSRDQVPPSGLFIDSKTSCSNGTDMRYGISMGYQQMG